ncbi:MAG: hypothetical protein AD742_21200 [Methylibium sp. NZG]|nr:MAG: hypothetical protein AD742_21200 [Methylibium sp. NZG]
MARELSHPVSGERTLQWRLRRNCSLTPRQLLITYLVLSALSLGIAGAFWFVGATLVLPFAGAEVAALGVALLYYARHAADGEELRLGRHALTVVATQGSRTESFDFQPEWVRVEPEHGDGSLLELSGQGRRVVIGRSVRPEVRRQLADELRWALRRWHPDVARADVANAVA